jgi:hypothetical protein
MDIELGQAGSLVSQSIQVGRIYRSTVEARMMSGHVIGQDHNDVGLARQSFSVGGRTRLSLSNRTSKKYYKNQTFH